MSNSPSPRLGRGLESLIPRSYIASGKSITTIPIDDIVANEFQPRLYFDEAALLTLSNSIKAHGLAQPIVVRRKGVGYELIAGERRFRACQMAGMASIPAIVKDLSDRESLQLALVENLDREDLSAIEEAKGFLRLIDEFDMTHQQIADLFSKSRSAVSNTVRLLKLPVSIQDRVSDGSISEGHARALISLNSEAEMLAFIEKIQGSDLTVRELEDSVGDVNVSRETSSGSKPINPFKCLSKDLSGQLGLRVSLKGSENKGALTLSFKSKDEYDRVIALLKNQVGSLGL